METVQIDFKRRLYFSIAFHLKQYVVKIGQYEKMYRLAKASIGTRSLSFMKLKYNYDMKEFAYATFLYESLEGSDRYNNYYGSWMNRHLRPFKLGLTRDVFIKYQETVIPTKAYPKEVKELAYRFYDLEDRDSLGILGDACEEYDLPTEADFFHDRNTRKFCSPACPIIRQILEMK